MNAKSFVNRVIFYSVIAGGILGVYVAARAQTTGGSSTAAIAKLGAQVVGEGTTRGAVACARCHGYDGASDGSGAFPALAGQSAYYLAEQLRQYASGERQNAIMGSIAKGLNDDELRSVAQYYANASPPLIARHASSADLVTRGKQFALQGDASARVQNCISCHGPNGEGQPPSVPFLAGQYESYIRLQLLMFKKGYRKSASMQDVAHNLPAPHAEAIAAYFDQLPLPSESNNKSK
ncbi:MAG: c-type cytochrome [Acidobacteriaceae bacterium]|nr:c-type cytochrome [Acidobacteriaceae bacterium]